MSEHTVHNRNNSKILGIPSSQKSSSLSTLTFKSRLKLHLESNMSECENDDPLLRSTSKNKDINSTYVISARTSTPEGKLALQRRTTRNKESSLLGSELGDTIEKTGEKCLTLQRRAKTDSSEKWKTTKTDCVQKWKTVQDVGGKTENNCASKETSANVKVVNNDKNSFVASAVPLTKDPQDIEMMADEKYKETFSALREANENVALKYSSTRAPIGSQSPIEVVKSGHLAAKPIQTKLDMKVLGAGNVHHRSIGKDTTKNSNKFGSLEKRTPVKCIIEHKSISKMMGFSEEPGIIPRFCEDLFAQVVKKQTQEVRYHLEMSFFEVYNEKIHDLLVCKGVNGQRKQPVRLKQSERCSTAHSSGDRLKEGVSINKSLLTLGKVISALSEQANQKRVFIPYRESVLTWLLKESLGGNSKTAMIATISPAASNIEETLSTLRYASQARLIVNVAKVNEDTSAKLIRELKAEIEKLKAAQRNSRNIDPERYRLSQQEITSLRMKLHQQERDMAEMQRAWKEKFEQAEKRKLQETKELQKAGITFQMDNHLPNLVNLNEDPQLSEMLLYMIKEGTTTVGKYKPNSSHDIQLSGVLIADDHCSLKNFGGTVSITPVGEAKTYVNGKCIMEPTVLHHGDRVILGGDHYFRFNHPVEVQKGKRPSSRDTLISEGPKDFEFAKNELLLAQRSQLEAEIKEAQLKAKEEMMQGIQIAKEMAQQELSSQKAAFESKIKALEAELKEESQRKKIQEINNEKANHKIEELEKAKQHLEQEIYVNKKRLQMETLATKQALEDHHIRHARILEALETEKQKIAKEVEILQQNRNIRDKTFTIQTNWSSMKLSMMIQEANAISSKLKTYYVFGRHDISDKGSADTSIRVRNLKLGISTFWSLEKFESKLAAMKELYESNGSNRSEDVICDPEDEWEPDITSAPVSSFSRRRSKSLMKNRRISGCLHDIQIHPVQNLHSSHWLFSVDIGLLEKSSIIYSNSAESFLPGICKELIGSSLDFLGQSYDEEKTIADSLMNNFLKIYNGLFAISKAHEEQDEESQDNLFSSDRATQLLTVQIASAFEQLVVLIKHWLSDFLPCTSTAKLEDELRQEVKKLGGYLQLFLQGCCSDISSMVKEAQEKVIQIVQQAIKHVGQLAVLKESKLHFLENSNNKAASIQEELMGAICDGIGLGMKILLDSGLEKTKELQHELLSQCTQNEVTKQMKANAMGLIRSLENIFAEWKIKSCRTQMEEENSGYQDFKKMINLAPEFFKLKHCLEQTIQIIMSSLRGYNNDVNLLKNSVESICNLASDFHGDFSVPCTPVDSCENKVPPIGHRELESVAKSLLLYFESEERPNLLKPWETCDQNPTEKEQQSKPSRTDCSKKKGVPKRVYELHGSSATVTSEGYTPCRIQWV
ncbi:kinesin-like protein KIF14 [Otolemur garnettii]|uniref:kinesin-like protein KIF14 n=1 Tax=Otolemur garnettii TaxID=30611 RepID=UPI0006445329|nr:kinesin-like protein KIF14 [Otolemur garnettii]